MVDDLSMLYKRCFEHARHVRDKRGCLQFFLCDIADIIGCETVRLVYETGGTTVFAPDGHLVISEKALSDLLQKQSIHDLIKNAIERGNCEK